MQKVRSLSNVIFLVLICPSCLQATTNCEIFRAANSGDVLQVKKLLIDKNAEGGIHHAVFKSVLGALRRSPVFMGGSLLSEENINKKEDIAADLRKHLDGHTMEWVPHNEIDPEIADDFVMLYALDAAHHCDIETIDTFLRTLGRPLEERHFETLAWRCATHPDIFGVLLNEDYGMVSDPGMAESMQKLESTSGDYERNTVITKYLTEHFKAVSEDIGDCTLCGDHTEKRDETKLLLFNNKICSGKMPEENRHDLYVNMDEIKEGIIEAAMSGNIRSVKHGLVCASNVGAANGLSRICIKPPCVEETGCALDDKFLGEISEILFSLVEDARKLIPGDMFAVKALKEYLQQDIKIIPGEQSRCKDAEEFLGRMSAIEDKHAKMEFMEIVASDQYKKNYGQVFTDWGVSEIVCHDKEKRGIWIREGGCIPHVWLDYTSHPEMESLIDALEGHGKAFNGWKLTNISNKNTFTVSNPSRDIHHQVRFSDPSWRAKLLKLPVDTRKGWNSNNYGNPDPETWVGFNGDEIATVRIKHAGVEIDANDKDTIKKLDIEALNAGLINRHNEIIPYALDQKDERYKDIPLIAEFREEWKRGRKYRRENAQSHAKATEIYRERKAEANLKDYLKEHLEELEQQMIVLTAKKEEVDGVVEKIIGEHPELGDELQELAELVKHDEKQDEKQARIEKVEKLIEDRKRALDGFKSICGVDFSKIKVTVIKPKKTKRSIRTNIFLKIDTKGEEKKKRIGDLRYKNKMKNASDLWIAKTYPDTIYLDSGKGQLLVALRAPMPMDMPKLPKDIEWPEYWHNQCNTLTIGKFAKWMCLLEWDQKHSRIRRAQTLIIKKWCPESPRIAAPASAHSPGRRRLLERLCAHEKEYC